MNTELVDLSEGMPSEKSLEIWNRRGATTVVVAGINSSEDLVPFLLKIRRYTNLRIEAVNCPPIDRFRSRLEHMMDQFNRRLESLREPVNFQRGALEASKAASKKAAERALEQKPRIEEAIRQVGESNAAIARWLNDKGHLNMRGEKWKPHNVQFLRSRLKELENG